MASRDTANDELWRGLLTGVDSPIPHDRARFKRLPGSPRCKTCLYPLGGILSRVMRVRTGRGPARKNPNYCNICEEFVRTHPGGAEVEISMLFADVRGSTPLAESMSPADYTTLLNRFFSAGNRVLIETDGIVDNFVGDEIVGFYIPVMAPDHPRRAINAARDLLVATGHADSNGPWLPIGASVHTGVAFVGSVGDGTVANFTAMGDPVNVAARLASAAVAGEVLITEDAWTRAAMDVVPDDNRSLELKGKSAPVDVRVLKARRLPSH